MDWKLEVVVLPVSDIDRAKRFYTEQVGFNCDVDTVTPVADFRVVQLTPPGSGCSVSMLSTFHDMAPGSLKGLQLVVADIAAAHKQLVEKGVDVTPVRYLDNGVWRDGHGGPWNSFMFFSDPDGNSWTVQEKPAT
ncbi:MAG: VOC family protein [Chloroflexi bacterium]|nr:VOC family protein [Chloroflexota bacterium]MBV9133938.1 VOC family protein [Chloroflexota bacterium]MBV9899045.1 VOC family protein [Chloroflexota bacterium]